MDKELIIESNLDFISKKPWKLEMNHVLETGNLGLGNWKEVRQEKEVFVYNEI